VSFFHLKYVDHKYFIGILLKQLLQIGSVTGLGEISPFGQKNLGNIFWATFFGRHFLGNIFWATFFGVGHIFCRKISPK
jgi:hypothetical protein